MALDCRSPSVSPHLVRRCRKRCQRNQKKGERGAIQARLAANPNWPAVPTIILSNMHSLDNKINHLQLLRSVLRDMRDCCVFVFTVTWLNDSIPDSAIQLDQLACYWADRALLEGGEILGGRVCVYIGDAWCWDSVVVHKHCSFLVELPTVKCRPFHLRQEFTGIFCCLQTGDFITQSVSSRQQTWIHFLF